MSVVIRFVFALVLLCSLCPSAPASTIRVGYLPQADCLQLYVAEDKYFFAAEGLAVIALPMQNSAFNLAAVGTDGLAIGWSNTVSFVKAHAADPQFAYLAAGAQSVAGSHDVHALVVPASASTTSLKGLAGKTVAINTNGNINETALRALAAKAGLSQRALRLTAMPYKDMGTALAEGKADAALVLEPFVTAMVGCGQARVLVPSPYAVFGSPCLIGAWFAKKSWIAAHPREATAFARAMARAADYITQHPAEARRILGERSRIAPHLADRIVLPDFPDRLVPASLQGVIDLLARQHGIPKTFPADTLLAAPAVPAAPAQPVAQPAAQPAAAKP